MTKIEQYDVNKNSTSAENVNTWKFVEGVKNGIWNERVIYNQH